jgi:hypothetical protein
MDSGPWSWPLNSFSGAFSGFDARGPVNGGGGGRLLKIIIKKY